MKKFLLLLGLFVTSGQAEAAPRFARVFSDGVVLQRDQENLIWGFGAEPGTALELDFGGEKLAVSVIQDGSWTAQLAPKKANLRGQSLSLGANGKSIAEISDVLIGDVWLAAGQSNMQFKVSGMVKGLPETKTWVEQSDFPAIRFRRIDDPVLEDSKAEAKDLGDQGGWVKMTPRTVVNFSAVSASFARKVHEETDVPIGIIDVSWGGKPIEPFIPRESFSTPFLEEIRNLADANALDELAKLHGGVIIRNPQGYPGAIFNARIAPLTQFGMRGFLWYQAESNAGRGEDPRKYRHKMAALASGWRKRWKAEPGNLPFYLIQLPGYPPATGWIRVREEQRRALDLISESGMVVTIDIPGDDIHPPDKIPVGERLARLALHGESGPIYQSYETDGNRVVVKFKNAEGGLKANTGELKWFEIVDQDGTWHPAEATISGDTVQVTNDHVSEARGVRYGCHTNPIGGNLLNGLGLPASPFCSELKFLPWKDQPPKESN